VFIEARDDGGGGDNWITGAVSLDSSQIITTNKPTSSFLQAGCPSCCPANSVKALKGKNCMQLLMFQLSQKAGSSKLAAVIMHG